MELLKKCILEEGFVLPGNVLKVDSFLNHQIDPKLSLAMGKEFARRFDSVKIDRVLTIEASGIALGLTTAYILGVPLVFARKKKSVLLEEEAYTVDVFSYTKKNVSEVTVLKKFMPGGENVLIVDDFLANGDSSLGLSQIVEEAGSNVAGVGIAVEKSFQKGRARLEEAGYRVESLARIASLAEEKVEFLN